MLFHCHEGVFGCPDWTCWGQSAATSLRVWMDCRADDECTLFNPVSSQYIVLSNQPCWLPEMIPAPWNTSWLKGPDVGSFPLSWALAHAMSLVAQVVHSWTCCSAAAMFPKQMSVPGRIPAPRPGHGCTFLQLLGVPPSASAQQSPQSHREISRPVPVSVADCSHQAKETRSLQSQNKVHDRTVVGYDQLSNPVLLSSICTHMAFPDTSRSSAPGAASCTNRAEGTEGDSCWAAG